MVAVGMERGDEKGGVIVKGIVLRDGEQEILLDVFILWIPDLLATFINNGVLVRVVGNGSGARQGGKEMGEELGFWGDGEQEVREDGSRWGRGGNDSDGGFSDRWREVFIRDVGKGDSFDNFFKLEVDVGILLFEGQGVLKLRAYYVSLLGDNVGEDVKEVGWGGGPGGWGHWGYRCRGAWWGDYYLGWGSSRCCGDYQGSSG
jgi:hypothetical protein